MFIQEYLGRIQLICDSLHNSGHPISETLQISTILVGLTVEYEHIVAGLEQVDNHINLDGVSSVLLDAEAHQQDNLLHINPNSVAFSVQTTNGSSSGQVNTNSSSVQYSAQPLVQYSSQQFPQYQHAEGFLPQNSYGRGRDRGNNFNSNKPHCQLCGKFGHLVAQCWYNQSISTSKQQQRSSSQYRVLCAT